MGKALSAKMENSQIQMNRSKCPAKVLDQGRVTIDVDTRRELGIEPGDHVILQVEQLEGATE